MIYQEKITQYEIYPDIISQYKIPQLGRIIPESEKGDKIPFKPFFSSFIIINVHNKIEGKRSS